MSGTTGSAHLNGATVYDANDYVGWGEAASGDYVIEPGMWSLDNYGTKLIALIVGGSCFEWDSSHSSSDVYSSNHYFRSANSIQRYVSFNSRSALSVLRN